MERYHKILIKNCALGLWHGRECYTTYSKWCTNSHLIHDVHTRRSDAIDPDTLSRKLAAIGTESTLRIAYAGRLSPMKAPLDWVKAVGRARDLGVSLQATWYGDGELREEVERVIESLQLGAVIRLAGFVSDRDRLLRDLRNSHIFLFTHVTPESPRCLLEALICGMPIIGYNNPFASDLTSELGGGAFVSIYDWKALGDLVADLAVHRSKLGRLVNEGAENGKRFNDEDLFRERSLLIRSMQAAS
jgi:glycosyltransferase involved in cell wall biosynthesis